MVQVAVLGHLVVLEVAAVGLLVQVQQPHQAALKDLRVEMQVNQMVVEAVVPVRPVQIMQQVVVV